MNKVAVFGLDGATFEVIRRGCERGELPRLGRLLERGPYGTLESTVPAITAAAWTSFQTGVQPERHGIRDWLVRDEGSYRLRLVNSSMVKERRLWDYAGEEGGRAVVVGLPVTFPPRPMNGLLVSGPLTSAAEGYTYPAGLARELEAEVGKFPCFPEHWRGRYEWEDWLERLERSITLRERIARYLLEKGEWDLFVLHFMETDSVQHQMWHLYDQVERPKYRLRAKGDPILRIYGAVDAAVGRLVDGLPPKTTVFLVSDHGFGPLYFDLNLNLWLLDKGYLSLKARPSSLLKRAAFRLGFTQEALFPWGERLRILGRGSELRHDRLRDLLGTVFLSFDDIDWRRTRAYSYGNVGQIFLNRRGREPQGIVEPRDVDRLVERLAGELGELLSPLDGKPVVERVVRKEQLSCGEAADRSPEILLVPRRGYMSLGATDFPSNRVLTPTFAGSGWHEPSGILIGSGEALRAGEVNGARLVDLLPTILHAMDLTVPPGLDGQVLESLFAPAYLRDHAVRYGGPRDVDAPPARETEGEDCDGVVRRRLRGLGYL